jgi:hypothetical protein
MTNVGRNMYYAYTLDAEEILKVLKSKLHIRQLITNKEEILNLFGINTEGNCAVDRKCMRCIRILEERRDAGEFCHDGETF